jgi:hypothetical protein
MSWLGEEEEVSGYWTIFRTGKGTGKLKEEAINRNLFITPF